MILDVMKLVLLSADFDCDLTLKERVKFKEKIVFETMRRMIPDWEPPQDWDTISDEEKLKRLDKVQND